MVIIPLWRILGGILVYYARSSYVGDLPESHYSLDISSTTHTWGHSSAGRAPAWHAGGQRFKSAWLHNYF
jgi:hypothetical protein